MHWPLKQTKLILLLFPILLGSRAPLWAQRDPDHLLLKDYEPRSVYKLPETKVARAKYSIIDMHSHPYAETAEQIRQWVSNKDDGGVEKTIILSKVSGSAFDHIFRMYHGFPERFELWCGLDFSKYDQPGFAAAAVTELESCYRRGAKGVGELSDKGEGFAIGESFAYGLHADDPRMDPIFEKCADLHLPINIHIAEPQWMYEPMDAHNDGLMNAYVWRRDRKRNTIAWKSLFKSIHARLSLRVILQIWKRIWENSADCSIPIQICTPISRLAMARQRLSLATWQIFIAATWGS